MIINNSPLGFSKESDQCDCASNNWSQVVALNDKPTWQVATECDEITGNSVKLPCEENMIGPYSEDFKRYDSLFVEQGLVDSVLLGNDEIRFIAFDETGNVFSTEAGFLEPNKCYNLSYTITGYTQGWMQFFVGTPGAMGANARTANGNYSEVYCTDADGRLSFQVGADDQVDPGTFVLSNLFINCIRYSQLYTVEPLTPTDPTPEFSTLSSICKDDQVYADGVLISLIAIPFMVGQTYKICFTISESNAGSIDLLFGPTTPVTYAGNGRYCIEIEYIDATYLTQLQFEMSDDFIGCLSEITVHLVPVIRVDLFDEQGEIVEDALTTEQIGSTLKVEMNATVPEGCYRIGVADNCSNYRNQFYGNILDADGYYSELVTNEDIGTWGPIVKTGTAWSMSLNGWADLAVGQYDFINYFVIRDSICYDKLYDAVFNLSIDDNGNTVEYIEISVQLAGHAYAMNIALPGATETFTFVDLLSGIDEAYESLNLPCPGYLCDLSGRNALLINISVTATKVNGTSPVVTFTSGVDSTLTMDQDTPQDLCPEYMSVPLKVMTAAPCDTLLIKYRNDNDAFDIDYTSAGYTEADDFYNKIRVGAKLRHPTYPRSTETQKNSNGTRNKYYADIDKKYTLSIEPVPEYMHDSLSDAIEHRTLIIDGKYLVADSEDYSPDWNKSTELAPVDIELFVQQGRKLNTEC